MEFNYKQLYNNSPIGYLVTKADGTVMEVNDKFLELTGYNREDVLNQKKMVDFLTGGSKIYFDTSYSVILSLKGEVNELSLKMRRKDMTELPVLLNSINILDDDGQFRYTHTSVIDISRRSRFEKQLIAAKRYSENLIEELTDLNKELENINYIASHDLRNPLLGISMSMEILSESLPKDEETEKLLQAHRNSVKKLDNTINNLTNSIKARKNEKALKSLNFGSILSEVTDSFKLLLEEVNGNLTVANPLDDTNILGNKVYVSSILQNVIENAIKYRSNCRKLDIQLTSKVERQFLCLTIRDNGSGIDLKKNKEKIWGLFNRFNEKGSGTGIGMHLIKGMIEQMDGKIDIESEVDKYTKISLYFKLAD